MAKLMSYLMTLVILLSLGATHGLYAQIPPYDGCPGNNDPCLGVPWTAATQYVVLSTGCVVQVSYAVRKCGNFCEVRLDNITALWTADGCQPCDPFLAGTTIQQITDEVLRYIYSRNRGTVPCGPFISPQDIRIYRAKCWHHALIAGRRVFTPCSGCCIIKTTVVTVGGVSTVFQPNPADVVTYPCNPLHMCTLELDCHVGPWLYGIPTP
jgi:hypothetical protein